MKPSVSDQTKSAPQEDSAEHVIEQENYKEGKVPSNEILKEIHHQVKNNLQMVCSLLRIQSRALVESGSREAFKRGEERIQTMALVYDMLYRGEFASKVPLHQYLPEIARQLVNSNSRDKRPQATCLVDNLLVSTRVATHIGLLINEMLSHRLRQDARDDGHLCIALTIRNDSHGATIQLQDNGPALNSDRSVSDAEKQILDALIRQVSGVVECRSNEAFCMQIAIPSKVLSAA